MTDVLGISAERLARIDSAMQRLVDDGQAAGLVTLVARDGQVVHFNTCGLLDTDSGRPMPGNALFRIASMTKPITAAAVMLLWERSEFLLDDPIATWLPEFASARVFPDQPLQQPITIRHLLTHTSGLAYPTDIAPSAVGDLYANSAILDMDEPLAAKIPRLARLPLAHQPGAAWTYGMSIDVLGRLVEVVSGQTFDAFIRSNLFEPLHMLDTGFHVSPAQADRLATVYTADLEPQTQLLIGDATRAPRFLMPGGGLISSASDYAHFASMLACGGTFDGQQILARKTVEFMLTSQMRESQIPFVPPDWGFRNGYGMALGGRTLVDVAASGLPGSAGSYTWQGAYSTDFWADPTERLIGVVMLQRAPCWFRPGELLRLLTYQALL